MTARIPTPRTDKLADHFGNIDPENDAYWKALDLATELERELAARPIPEGSFSQGWDQAVTAAAKLLRTNAANCTEGSPAEQQNWPFVLESMAREVEKLRVPQPQITEPK